ncbi:MAG: RimK family alpha-L-glutamate ligase [Candidatus Aphodosoma sp.]
MKLGILTGYKGYTEYIEACRELNIEYEVVDILTSDWMANIKRTADGIDGYLVRPLCAFQEEKSIYDERLHFLSEYFHKPLYPNYKSLYIYESKRMMAAFMEFHGIPHTETKVFINADEALDYFKTTSYPKVQKSNIGSGGSTVSFIRNYRQAKHLVRQAFGFRGGNICRGIAPIKKKLGIPFRVTGLEQKHYMIVQDFHEIKWEWRIIKVGNSYMGHQKLLKGNKASGSGLVGWVAPPEELLYMVKDICDKGNFDVMDADIFETVDGQFLVNELQAIFGSYLPYQMRINDRPGRYVYIENRGFVFEEGEFNRIGSKLLFVEDFVKKLNNGQF